MYHRPIAHDLLEPLLSRFDQLRARRGSVYPIQIRKQLQQMMSNYAGIFRTGDMLAEGKQKLRELWNVMQNELHVRDTSLLWNNDLIEALETDNLMRQSTAVLAGAYERTESRGAHFREDFPKRDDECCLMHSMCFIDDHGNTRFQTRPVRSSGEDPKTKTPISFPPEVRVY